MLSGVFFYGEVKMSGWVKLFRDIEKWEWIDDAFTYWAFTRMVLMANFEDKSWQGVNIPRGSFVTSLENLAVKFRCSTSRIRELQKRLKSTNEITIKTTNKYSMITIVNYEKYNSNEILQQTEQQTEQQTNRKQTANKTTTTKESKNIRTREGKNIKSPLSVYFTESEIIEWLGTGNESLHQNLIKEYDQRYLVEQIKKAYYWQTDNKKRKAGSYISSWLERDDKAIMFGGLTRKQLKLSEMLKENEEMMQAQQ